MNSTIRCHALACTLVASAGAFAADPPITSFTSQSAFLAAVTLASTDNFDNLTANSELGGSVTRTIGAYSYSASATGGLYAVGGAGSDVWLSVDTFSDTLAFNGFSNNVYAVGGYFFGTNTDGAVLPSQTSQAPQTLAFTVTNTAGASYQQQVVLGSQTTFLGVTSSAPIASLSLYANNNFFSAYPTVNNLILAAAVPEPSTYMLLALGLSTAVVVRRRRH